MKEETFFSDSSNRTKQIGFSFAEKLKKGDYLAFFGELGSGKTTFIQGMAEGMGVSKRILSPTFIVLRSYFSEKFKRSLRHIDLYRIEDPTALKNLGLEDIIDKDDVVAVEWAERLKFLPEKRIELYFENLGDEKRKIIIKRYE
jgi:tRNA threonylcarbamoyladenosine biosynthesis protein TsaE